MIFSLLRKTLPVLLALAALILLAVEHQYPVAVLIALPIWIAASIFSFFIIAGHEGRHPSFWLLAMPTIVTFSGAVLFLLIADNLVVRWVFTLFPPIAIALFGYTLYLFVHQPARYQTYALEYLSLVLNLCGFFLFGASFLGYVVFLSLPQWTMILGLFGVGGLLLAETLWVSKVPSERQPLLVFIGSLLLAQAAMAALLLPTSFLVGGALLALTYYVVVGFMRAHALGSLDKVVVRRYALTSLVSLVILLATARWT